jgi:type IV secretory pathway TrbL component
VFWAPTRSMAGGVFSYALNVCFRFFIQAILASLIVRLAPILVAPITRATVFDIAIEQALIMVITAFVLTYLFWKIPAVIAQYLGGAPTLSAGGFMQTVAGLAGMATGATMLLRSGGPAWAIRRAPALPPGPRPMLPAPRPVGPPPMPAAQALTTTLRAGAQFLGRDHGGSGAHVSV